jgi:hypothetical protein
MTKRDPGICVDCGHPTRRSIAALYCFECLEQRNRVGRSQTQEKFLEGHPEYYRMYRQHGAQPRGELVRTMPLDPPRICEECGNETKRNNGAMYCFSCVTKRKREYQQRMFAKRQAREARQR